MNRTLFLVAAFTILFSTLSLSDNLDQCNAPELFDGALEYNKFVCTGLEKLEAEKYEEAIALFESASAVPLFEVPNFEILPRLALSYYLFGDEKSANKILRKFEMSMSVFAGLLGCEETEAGFSLQKRNGVRLTGEISSDAAEVMCGAAYDYIYERNTFDRLLVEASLVEHYLKIKSVINPELAP